MSDRVRLFLFIGLTLFGAVVLLFAAVGVLVAGPTLLQWSIDGYQGHELFSSASPDGRYRIGGSVRVDFPANEMLDPSGTLRITLLDSHTGKLLDELSVGLFEAATSRSRRSSGSQTEGFRSKTWKAAATTCRRPWMLTLGTLRSRIVVPERVRLLQGSRFASMQSGFVADSSSDPDADDWTPTTRLFLILPRPSIADVNQRLNVQNVRGVRKWCLGRNARRDGSRKPVDFGLLPVPFRGQPHGGNARRSVRPKPGPGQLHSRKLISVPNPLCTCELGWFCEQHPGQPLGHDGCRDSGCPCMNTTCPYGRENLSLLKSGVGIGAELADSNPDADG